ncbi:MAG: DUF547 domain-containing protein [Sedimenticola sp.]
MNRFHRIILWLTLTSVTTTGFAFDQGHEAWDRLLKSHVHWNAHGTASMVDYQGMQRERKQLNGYLESLSTVNRDEYDQWSKQQQLAFLINAYNAFTVELILTRYPNIDSIKDLGSLFSSPWKKRFFSLLGQQRHLDTIEHDMIRKPGVFDDPRIHVAVVCASIGCPALRNEAFTAERLDHQLEDSLKRFLSDRSRNRYNPATSELEVSRIFDWYREDFEKGHRGIDSLKDLFASNASLLTEDSKSRERISNGQIDIDYLDYDWRLNDLHR